MLTAKDINSVLDNMIPYKSEPIRIPRDKYITLKTTGIADPDTGYFYWLDENDVLRQSTNKLIDK